MRREAGTCDIPDAKFQPMSAPAPYPEFTADSGIPEAPIKGLDKDIFGRF